MDGQMDGPAFLYGHSLGGLIACVLAARHPSAVRAVILEDAPLFEIAPQRFHAGPNKAAFGELATRIATADPDALAQDIAVWPSGFEGQSIGAALRPAEVRRRAAALAQTDPEALRAPCGNDFLTEAGIPALLRRIACPVHLLAGAPSRGSVLAHADRDTFRDLAQDGHVHAFDHIRHDIRAFDPGPCAALVMDCAAGSSARPERLAV